MYIGRWKLPRTLTKIADRVLRSAAILLAPLAKMEPTSFWTAVQPAVVHIKGGLYIPAILVLAPFTAWLRGRVDNARLDEVHVLLNELCQCTFKNETFELEQHRRVTLFKFRRFRMRWLIWRSFAGCLVPIERSGEQTRWTKAIFLAPDNGEKCEGIAGRTWARGNMLSVENLPELSSASRPEVLEEYATKSFITVSRARFYARSKRTAARSILGFTVEVDGKKWGVIVFDSVHVTMPVNTATKHFKRLNKSLGGLLKGV